MLIHLKLDLLIGYEIVTYLFEIINQYMKMLTIKMMLIIALAIFASPKSVTH